MGRRSRFALPHQPPSSVAPCTGIISHCARPPRSAMTTSGSAASCPSPQCPGSGGTSPPAPKACPGGASASTTTRSPSITSLQTRCACFRGCPCPHGRDVCGAACCGYPSPPRSTKNSATQFKNSAAQLKIQKQRSATQLKNSAAQQRSAAQLNSIQEQRNSIQEQRNSIQEQRNSIQEQRNSIQEQRNSIQEQRNSIQEQRSATQRSAAQLNSKTAQRNSRTEQALQSVLHRRQADPFSLPIRGGNGGGGVGGTGRRSSPLHTTAQQATAGLWIVEQGVGTSPPNPSHGPVGQQNPEDRNLVH